MRSLLFLTVSLFLTAAFAFPQKVQLSGAFHSSRGGTDNVVIELTLKKQSATKVKYVGQAHFSNNLLAQNQRVELNMNLTKGKTEGVLNLFNGYVAFDTKAVYTLELNQQLQMKYSEYHDELQMPPCNPIQNNFCRPGQTWPRLTDTGALNLTVVQTQ